MITKKYTGKFSVSGIGRVGSYESAKAGRRCRARRYWGIFEDLGEVIEYTETQPDGSVYIWRTNYEERQDLGKFKTKTASIQFLVDSTKDMAVEIIGDITGYPKFITK